jgi:hypothetical protein
MPVDEALIAVGRDITQHWTTDMATEGQWANYGLHGLATANRG